MVLCFVYLQNLFYWISLQMLQLVVWFSCTAVVFHVLYFYLLYLCFLLFSSGPAVISESAINTKWLRITQVLRGALRRKSKFSFFFSSTKLPLVKQIYFAQGSHNSAYSILILDRTRLKSMNNFFFTCKICFVMVFKKMEVLLSIHLKRKKKTIVLIKVFLAFVFVTKWT